MLSEAEQFGNVFERMGREVLALLDGLPESTLHWALPLPQGVSLFTHATCLVEESAFWVFEVVGGKSPVCDRCSEKGSGGTFADLNIRYAWWFKVLHTVLDSLPDAVLDLFVDVPSSYKRVFGDKKTTVRACLLYAVQKSAVHVGHIQLIRQLFADGERVLHEVAECQSI
jgi:Protein of unknown function (DUF664)